MKTSLYLTDVVVLRHEGDTVDFLGVFRSPRQARVLRWKTVQTSCNPFWIFTRWKTWNRRPILVDVRQWWSSCQQLLWMVMITPTFAQPSENSSSWHLGDRTCNLPSNNCPHQSSSPRQRASAQWSSWYDVSKARNTLVFASNRTE